MFFRLNPTFKLYKYFQSEGIKIKTFRVNKLNEILRKKKLKIKTMSLKITINKVVLVKQIPVFILVQLSPKGQSQQKGFTQKYRTQLSLSTCRPKFHSNQFNFNLLSQKSKTAQLQGNQVFSLKFGLMVMPCDNYGKILTDDYSQAKPIGITSFNLSIQRLRQAFREKTRYFDMVDSQGKVHGQFQCVIEYFERINGPLQFENNLNPSEKGRNSSELKQEIQSLEVSPLIKWMLYDQNCQDPIREASSIKALQEQSNLLYQKFHDSKDQQQRLERLYNELQQDEKQLLQQIQMYQKMNNQISQKLNQKESLESMKLEIEMLKGTIQGKQLLLQKLEYLQDRIFTEENTFEDLSLQYQKLKPFIQQKLQLSQQTSLKLKGKEQQQFEINTNQQILKNFEQFLYEYKSNQKVIEHLLKLSKKSSSSEFQYTRQQAQIFLSQVKYEIKLEEMDINKKMNGEGSNNEYENKMLELIEDQMKTTNITNERIYSENSQNREEQDFVLRIKLESLLEEIQFVKSKILKIKDKSKSDSKIQIFNEDYNQTVQNNRTISKQLASTGFQRNKSQLSTKHNFSYQAL